MEELNKNQLILLALLVSFVTSIATGIVTVSLVEQAPQSVTQTINRVVTQTIERVATPVQTAAIIKTVPEEDLISAAVEENSKGIVKIRLGEGGDVVGYGFTITPSGVIATDVNPLSYAPEAKYFAVFQDAKELAITLMGTAKSGITFFQTALGEDPKTAYKPNVLELGDSDKLKLGQTVLIVAPSGDTVLKGTISSLVREILTEGGATSTPATETPSSVKIVKLIRTSISFGAENSGNPLTTLDGGVVGLTVYKEGVRVAVPSNILKASLAEVTETKSSVN